MTDDNLIKKTLDSAKTIAMIGASTIKEDEAIAKTRLKPSIIVMKYLLEFGFKVIPINPFSVGKKNTWRNYNRKIRRCFYSN